MRARRLIVWFLLLFPLIGGIFAFLFCRQQI